MILDPRLRKDLRTLGFLVFPGAASFEEMDQAIQDAGCDTEFTFKEVLRIGGTGKLVINRAKAVKAQRLKERQLEVELDSIAVPRLELQTSPVDCTFALDHQDEWSDFRRRLQMVGAKVSGPWQKIDYLEE